MTAPAGVTPNPLIVLCAPSHADVLQTQETNPLEPGVAERKYYARGVGPIFVEGVSGSFERSQLVDFTQK